jgi:hypothetical protein
LRRQKISDRKIKIYEQDKRKMLEKKKRKLIGKIDEIQDEALGESLYVRPFEQDAKIINEITRQTGLKKGTVAQKLIRVALDGRRADFSGEKREKELLEWLVGNEKHKAVRADVLDARIERLEEHARGLEEALQEVAKNARFTRVLASEIYCGVNVCMSYLNQTFTKIIEYLSPVEIEKKNSTDFANRNILGLVEHSLAELEKLSEHHDLDLESVEPEMLYLFTKIEKIKTRLLSSQAQPNA